MEKSPEKELGGKAKVAQPREAPCWHLFKQPRPLLGRSSPGARVGDVCEIQAPQQARRVLSAHQWLCEALGKGHRSQSSGSTEREKAGDGLTGLGAEGTASPGPAACRENCLSFRLRIAVAYFCEILF